MMLHGVKLTKAKLWQLALDWADYEEEHGTLILGYSLKFLFIREMLDDIL